MQYACAVGARFVIIPESMHGGMVENLEFLGLRRQYGRSESGEKEQFFHGFSILFSISTV